VETKPATLAPGPKSPLRNYLRMRRAPLPFWEGCVRRYGGFVHVPFGPVDVVLLSDPTLIERVLIEDTASYRKHFGTRILKAVVGEGLLTNEGDSWLRQRRLAQPAFHKKRIESYAGAMVDYTARTLETWRDGETRDVHEELSRLTLEIVGKTLFDADVRPRAHAVGGALGTVLGTFERRLASGFHLPFWVPTPRNRRFRRATEVLEDLIQGILAERRAAPGDRGDLLSMLTAARDEATGAGMSQEQLRDEVMTLVLAGHETTANTLVWTFHLLSENPAVESRLAEELAGVLGPPAAARVPTLEDVPRLPYAADVLRESMRLYPAAWGVGREAAREADVGPWRIAPRTTVLILQWTVHRDERFFARAASFEPERWAGDFARSLPRFAYFPFGGGPRQCIGNAFATMEATLLLATIASRWRLRGTGTPVEPVAAATLRPRGPVPMRLERRR
jgi:cytochrome P450